MAVLIVYPFENQKCTFLVCCSNNNKEGNIFKNDNKKNTVVIFMRSTKKKTQLKLEISELTVGLCS